MKTAYFNKIKMDYFENRYSISHFMDHKLVSVLYLKKEDNQWLIDKEFGLGVKSKMKVITDFSPDGEMHGRIEYL